MATTFLLSWDVGGVPILSSVYFPNTFTDKCEGKLYEAERKGVD